MDHGPGGVLAIVIDDIGFDPPSRTLLASLEGPLALAVIPNAPHGAEAARLAREKGWDLLVHLPMDPEAGRAEKDSLGPKDDDAAIRAGVLAALTRFPGALGINNHQGSKATADARVVRDVLEVVKERGLLFLDSRTTPASVAGAEAAKLGVPFLARDVFLDDAATESADPGGAPGALETAWEKGIALAKKRGQAIVIGHPRKETLASCRRSSDCSERKTVRERYAFPNWSRSLLRILAVLFGLDPIPLGIQICEGNLLDLFALGADAPRHFLEAPAELVVRGLERGLGIHAVAAGDVHDGEQEVADLAGHALLSLAARRRQLGLELGDLLVQLDEDVRIALPVEPEVRRARGQAHGLEKSGKGARDAVEGRRGRPSFSRSLRLSSSHCTRTPSASCTAASPKT